jgi:hypothetical protein
MSFVSIDMEMMMKENPSCVLVTVLYNAVLLFDERTPSLLLNEIMAATTTTTTTTTASQKKKNS